MEWSIHKGKCKMKINNLLKKIKHDELLRGEIQSDKYENVLLVQ